MIQRDAHGSVRIRTGEGNEWRYDAIQAAADYYGCNRSDAVAFACEDVDGVMAVPERSDLTGEKRREIAETLSTRGVRFGVETTVVAEKNPD